MPLFPFHITDRTWQTLEWHKVSTTEELLELRTKQFAAIARDRYSAATANEESRVQAAQDFARRNARRLTDGIYPSGTMVLVYRAKYDVNQKFQGNKYRYRWAGPYRVRKRLRSGAYLLDELDGAQMRGAVAGNRIKIFYERTGIPPVSAQHALDDDSDDSDKLGLTNYDDKDEEYIPSNPAKYYRNPNWLSTYRKQEPDWSEVWERWKARERTREPGSQTGDRCEFGRVKPQETRG